MFRFFSNVSGVAGVALLACAGYGALSSQAGGANGAPAERPIAAQAQDSGLSLENPEVDLGEVPPGDHQITFRVVNRSDHPAEVVGGSRACNATCCMEVQEQGLGRVPVPPGGTATITSKMSVRNPGPFEFEGELYLNDAGLLRAIRLKITGTATTKGKGDVPPKP